MSVFVGVSERNRVGCIGRNRCGVYGCPIASRGVIVAVTVVLEWFVNPLVKSTVTLVTHSSTPPLFGRGLQPGSPLSAITVVCSSASSKVCVSAMLRNSLFLRKRSGSLRTSHPTPGGMSSTTRTEAGGFFVSGVTISLLRCGAATLVLFLPSSIVSPIRVKALGYGQVPVWWGGQCGGVSGQGW
ncbi:hypothetical protein NNA59_06255 [Cutibacterium acnes]|uniref:hypothetical protein n=1 Tax=Cutibacterium acnes TaxID=1747 RepID=UPI0020CFA0C0|nr:hypothetical protein [Cutibacterium acnes]MCP9416587.1 hypothetical protein [Cutibacterium acnes]